MVLFWRLFDTLILVAGLVYVTVKFIKPFFDNRAVEIHNTIERAKEAERKAAELLSIAENKLKDVKREIEFIKGEALREAEIEKNKIISEAGISAEKIMENYLAMAKSQIDKHKAEIYNQALEKSFKIAVLNLHEKLRGDELKRINENTLNSMEESVAEK